MPISQISSDPPVENAAARSRNDSRATPSPMTIASVAAQVVAPGPWTPRVTQPVGDVFEVDPYPPDPAAPPPHPDLAFRPLEIRLDSAGADEPAGRTILKPSPYTRVVWSGAASGYTLAVDPPSQVIEPGGAVKVTVTLRPALPSPYPSDEQVLTRIRERVRGLLGGNRLPPLAASAGAAA